MVQMDPLPDIESSDIESPDWTLRLRGSSAGKLQSCEQNLIV